MRAQAMVSDQCGIDGVSGRIEAIEGHAGHAKGGAPAQPYFNAKSVPAIYNGGPNGDTLKAVGRNEELAQERIEGANEIRMVRDRVEAKRPALAEKLINGRIGEGQDGDALSRRKAGCNPLHALNDGARFSAAGARPHECLARVLDKGALFRRGLAHPATARMASRK
jgi:hypothetical protein